jgi:eukaryotic-like serine/threonine-protein kinase
MEISSGARLGPYVVISALGAGGMGEVWRAKDTRLEREVAIKVLPAGFAEDALLRIRFDREAKAISSLNHPHICTLHDVGHENGLHFLVMELIDGESLADKLQRGPFPPEQVLRYGAQIATALDAAHRQGVIHRDLKPGNIMITKTGAKLLDFGLAKASDAALSGHSVLPTQAKPVTQQGTILGTFQYMSPEQLEGIEVDARSDIFALGAVLYEMATGRRAFQGTSKTSLIAAIVSSQPAPISTIAPLTPPALEHVVRKCLEKDPDERWQSAHDVASELRWISEAGSQAGVVSPGIQSRRSRRTMLTAAAILGWIGAIAAGVWIARDRARTEPLRRVFRADLILPAEYQAPFVGALGTIAISPDGRRIVYPTRQQGLVVHDFETGSVTALERTRDGMFPFWSPDSRWIGFFQDGKLRKVEASGGAVQTLCDAKEGRGGTWNRNGTILFAPDIAGPLMKVDEAGGTPAAVTRVPSEKWSHRNPYFLPDGERFLLTVRNSAIEGVGSMAVGSLGSAAVKPIAPGSNPQYAGGVIFFVRDRNLLAQPFDARRGMLTGSPSSIAQNVDYFNPKDLGNFSVSDGGVLAYRQWRIIQSQVTWVDRAGKVLAEVGDPGRYTIGRLSASGTLATVIRRDENDLDSVWVMDLRRGTVTRSTENFGTGMTRAVPDASGRQIAVSTWRDTSNTKGGAWIQSPAATGVLRQLFQTSDFSLEDWSRDGTIILGSVQNPGKGFDIMWVTVSDSARTHEFAASPHNERAARLSPNGRWLAYVSDDGGSLETYLSDFPGRKNRWQVTRMGGEPVGWTPEGRELLVISRGQLTAYDVRELGDELEIGSPHPLFQLPGPGTFLGAVASDRMLILKRSGDALDEPLRIIRNWQALVR